MLRQETFQRQTGPNKHVNCTYNMNEDNSYIYIQDDNKKHYIKYSDMLYIEILWRIITENMFTDRQNTFLWNLNESRLH